MNWKEIYINKLAASPQEAVKIVESGDRIYVGTSSGVAFKLIEALYERRSELRDVTICSGQQLKILPIYTEEAKEHFHILTYFSGPAEREAMKAGNADYTSFHLSQIDLWCREIGRANVAFLEVSPPDSKGYFSYGAYGCSINDSVLETAEKVVLQINPNCPYVYGEGNLIHISRADVIVEAADSLAEVDDIPANDTITAISNRIIEEIPDGATIQLGLGGISNAIGYGLKDRCDLGIHSEMMTGSMMYLMKRGVVNNRKKNLMPGKSVVSFALGTRELYDFIDHNEDMYFAPYTYVNDPRIIAQNDNFISVNTAMSIDLFGQVAADNLGGRQYSAIGGQVDFVRGAQMSRGGKSFIAVTSTVKDKSRIVSSFPRGTAVTTARSDVQYVATEYGCVNLKTLTARQRALALISLAHPDYREALSDEARQLGIL